MRTNLSKWTSLLIKIDIVLVGLFTMFGFWSLSTDVYETPKFLFLALTIGILLILGTLKSIFDGKVILHLTPFDLPLIGLLVIAAFSTFFSSSQYVSLLGNAPKINGGLLSLLLYVIFYFVLVSVLKGVKESRVIIAILLIGGILLSIVTILSYFGVYVLPLAWTKALNFTPTGSSFSTTAILAMLLPFPIISILGKTNSSEKIMSAAMLLLFGICIALAGVPATYIAGIGVVILTALVCLPTLKRMRKQELNLNLSYIGIPLVISVIVAILSQTSFNNNYFYTQAQNFPREVTLSLPDSWKISVSAFRDSPLVGTGPATYIFNFTSYKPANFNNTPYWNNVFSAAFNQYLEILGTLGGIGLVVFLILTVVYIGSAQKIIKSNDPESANGNFDIALSVSGIIFFLILLFHSSTLVTWVFGILIIALFVATNPTLTKELRLKIGATAENGGMTFDIFPVIMLLFVLGIVGFGGYYITKLALADYHYRKAVNIITSTGNLVASYQELVQAENLNLHSDLYRTDLAQTSFALANALATAKAPTKANPKGSLTADDKTNITKFLQQAIAEGDNGTALSPRSSNNWQVLGSIYKQMSGVVQNAFPQSLNAYGHAIENDPLNPALRLTIGGIYYSLKNYDLAIRFFTDAANLKPDYANAYFNLSIALRDKGDLQGAQTVAETLVSIVNPKSPDYKTASTYLSDLKARIATGSAAQSQITPPAAAPSSTFQENQKQKILNVPAPATIATPAAVKK